MTKVRFRDGNRSRGGILLAGVVCFLLCVGVGLAVADPGPEEPGASEVSLLVPESQAGGLPSGESSSVEAGPQANPRAAEELPHSGLDRGEAEELLTSVFPSALEEPAGIFGGELEVEEFHSDHVAVVAPPSPGAQPGLLSSLLPLRTEGAEGEKEAVDLELERSGGEVDPANPLVEVQIPGELGEGITLPESNVGIDLAGDAGERSASVVEGSATFYPNVAPDTDLAVAPTPTGVETFTQLRSAQAPQSQTFHLSLPAGAALRESADGGAEIAKGEEVLVAVPPPSAIDAEGSEVPVSLSVSGDALTLRVEPQGEAAYPLLVDPVYESYSWMNSNNSTGIYSDWRPASSNESILKPGWIGVWGEAMHAGLDLRSYPGAAAPGYQANWNYYVPRFFSDYENPEFRERPTSFIRNMTLSQVYYLIEEGSPVHEDPYLLVGLWDEKKGEFSTVGTRTGSQGGYNNQTIQLKNESEYVEVKNGGIALATAESASYPRQAFVGSATVELSDQDSPAILSIASPSGWLNEAPSPIKYTTLDPGLGIYSFQVNQPVTSGGSTLIATSNQCLGTASNPCPRKAETAGRTLAYEPKTMPQGVDGVRVLVSDPVGHQTSSESIPIKIDHTAPTLSLSGSLTEQATLGTHLTSYALNYAAADGDEAAPAASAPIGTAGTGAGQMQRPFGIAVDKSGDIWAVDRENDRVEEFGAKGEFLRQFGMAGTANGQFSNPQGIAVSPSGNVWVSDPGNKRLQEFNEKGEFLRSLTYAGGLLGAGKMSEPYALATGPEETLWVTDSGSHRVYQFKENGTFVRAISAAGPLLHETNLTTPAGIAVDRFGDAYIAEQSSSQIIELGPGGNYVNEFGAAGTGQGQLSGPAGLAIAASGNVLLADGSDNRIEEFKPDGTFLREFGALGSEAGQLREPRGIAAGPENTLFVADAGNHRIARWAHADKDPQSGAAKVEVKVDGSLAKTESPGCATRDCQLAGSWTMNADKYPAGPHKVEVTATDGVGLTTTKTLSVETHGDLTPPQVALSGSMTEQATLGTTLPSYKLKVAATDPGSAEERKSGVAMTLITVDGATVDTGECATEGCAITREWTLTSKNYAAGTHKVQVTAWDRAGHTTTKTLTIAIERDTSAPTLKTELDELVKAPEGWVEQHRYYYLDEATDPGGYGVTSLQLKIDGNVVATSAGTCSAGSCTKTLFGEINMAAYSGGAHPAELIATDGAGNVRKRAWTINVDPEGHISTSEATDTLEAVEQTSESNLVGEAAEEAEIEGTVPGLRLKEGEGDFVATGSVAPTTFGSSPDGPMTVEIPSGEKLYGCGELTKEPESIELETTESEAPGECRTAGSLVDMKVTPLGQAETAAAPDLIEENSVVSANTGIGVDTTVRPLNEGGMIFTAIRDESAPGNYSYRVELAEEQELKPIDDQRAEVYYAGFGPAFAITAEPAHDAVGTTVPTTLSVEGKDIVTLHVHYKTEEGAEPFVFPVVAGTGWQGGFQKTEVEMPTSSEEEGAEVDELFVSAPEPITLEEEEAAESPDPEALEPPTLVDHQQGNTKGHFFRWIRCRTRFVFVDPTIPDTRKKTDCGNPFTREEGSEDTVYSFGIRGHFYVNPGVSVSHVGTPYNGIECAKMLYRDHFGGLAENEYFIDKAEPCQWLPKTGENGGKRVVPIHHLTAYGEWKTGIGEPGEWRIKQKGSAVYIFATPGGYSIENHKTTCPDC